MPNEWKATEREPFKACVKCGRELAPHVLYEVIGHEPYCVPCADRAWDGSLIELAAWLESIPPTKHDATGMDLYTILVRRDTLERIVAALQFAAKTIGHQRI